MGKCTQYLLQDLKVIAMVQVAANNWAMIFVLRLPELKDFYYHVAKDEHFVKIPIHI